MFLDVEGEMGALREALMNEFIFVDSGLERLIRLAEEILELLQAEG